jgi:hypothetical protein
VLGVGLTPLRPAFCFGYADFALQMR